MTHRRYLDTRSLQKERREEMVKKQRGVAREEDVAMPKRNILWCFLPSGCFSRQTEFYPSSTKGSFPYFASEKIMSLA